MGHVELQKQITMLKLQLKKAGITAADCVSLDVARKRMHAAVQKLLAGDETGEAEKDIERWDQAIRMNPDYEKEQQEQQRQWDESQREANTAALRRMLELNKTFEP